MYFPQTHKVYCFRKGTEKIHCFPAKTTTQYKEDANRNGIEFGARIQKVLPFIKYVMCEDLEISLSISLQLRNE